MDRQLPLRITVVRPPTGVAIQVQRGRAELLAPTDATDDTLTFDFAAGVGDAQTKGPPRILGDFAQGPSNSRFVYVNAGKRAGQAVLAQPGAVLEARIAGTAPDGGPAGATVQLLDRAWRIVRGPAANRRVQPSRPVRS